MRQIDQSMQRVRTFKHVLLLAEIDKKKFKRKENLENSSRIQPIGPSVNMYLNLALDLVCNDESIWITKYCVRKKIPII